MYAIRSYYEDVPPHGAREGFPDLLELLEHALALESTQASQGRITSYNVFYTKLLRGQGAGGERAGQH